jgi:hypothetical protein
MRSIILLFLGFLLVGNSFAQDTIRKREVNVSSTFKPVLKEAAKINFNASPAITDTTRPRLQYEIPNQNLVLAYQPGSLKPLALNVDTGGRWDNYNYAKLGYGSLKTPYFETGLSLGDGNTAGLNIYARHISSKGKIKFQDYSNTDVDLNGFIKTGNNLEWSGRFGAKDERYNKYGYEPKTMVFSEDSIKIKFETFKTRVSLRNINRTELGISYSPQIKLDVFNDRLKNRESNAYFNLPLQKTLGGKFEAAVALEGNLTRYSPDNKKTIKSNYFSLAPSLLVKTENLNLQVGIKPSWDNGEFKLLPNIMAELSSPDKRFTLLGGWIGYLRSNTYQSLAAYNPWIWAPGFSNNSRIEEIYGGFKGSLTDHFSYNVKLGLNKITNLPFFINDKVSGKSFSVVQEPDVRNINIKGELGYTVGEKFSLRSGLNLNNYSSLDVNDKPWGLPPLEFFTTIRLQILKDLFVKGDLFAFDAPWYEIKDDRGRLKGALDLSAGLEFAVVKNVKLWAQFNNIMNNEYQRWRQYPSYGFNLLGGVVFSFAQNNK